MPGSGLVRSCSRRWVALAAALLVTAFVAACGNDDDDGGNQASAKSSDDCGFAYVFSQPIAETTAEQTIQSGLKQAEADFDVNIDITDGTGLPSLADNLRAAAAKGCYRAIGTAFFASGEALTQVAKDYPDQQFFIEGGIAEGPNVTSYSQASEQGTYVAGAMAAQLTNSGTIGIILGDESPPLQAFSAGFAAGAKSVDPDVEVLTNAVGSFTDAAKAGSTAVSQAGKGADLIYPAAGSNLQIYFLGEKNGYRTIGSDLSDLETAKARNPAIAFVAASAEGNTNYAIIEQYVKGTKSDKSTVLGLKDGVVEIPYVTEEGTPDYELPADVIAAGKKAYDDVVSGKVTVPTS